MNAIGLIFSNIHDYAVPELTRRRAIASIPFGGRYRMIDFELSNMVNSDITKVGVITNYNYQSLMDHIGTGKDWDLARRSGGIKLLPPFVSAYDSAKGEALHTARIELLKGAINFIERSKEEYVVMTDCDRVCTLDYQKIMDRHIESRADITIVTHRKKVTDEGIGKEILIDADMLGRIDDISEHTAADDGYHNVSMNIFVMKRLYLLNIIRDAMAHGYKSFYHDIIAKNLMHSEYYIYNYEGFSATVNSLSSFFEANMDLLKPEIRAELFEVPYHPVYTKVRSSAPTKYRAGAMVTNSLIADGCVIEGTVENSIIFRGVTIGRGTVIKNSIVMQDSIIGKDVNLNCVIADKNTVIRDGRKLSGHETLPFFIDKGVII
ncbi:MAG: glucose-1-phosphate adenylyltransferase subunit GlgD [Clostridia bacterium]|nr:glucose-1-phosphate adenylyltransferase subunit GlgD [Clostridia bacterium]